MNMYTVTKQEQETIKRRTEETVQMMQMEGETAEKLRRYAEENGYSEEEARILIEEEVIPAVDEYNQTCRELMDGDMREKLEEKIFRYTEDMPLEEECKYMLGFLIALRSMGRDVLARAGVENAEERAAEFEELNERELELLERGEYNEELRAQIVEELLDTIENSGIELELCSRMQELIDSGMDSVSIQCFVMGLWQDEQAKYCAATAVCVARKNGELPSIPEDATDHALVIGVCQGIDTANIEVQVSMGEMAADAAYKALKVIAAAGLTLVLGAGMFLGTLAISKYIMEAVAGILGSSLIATIAGVALGGLLFFSLAEEAGGLLSGARAIFCRASDFTYDKLKQGAKTLYSFVREKAVPNVKESLERIWEFLGTVVGRLRAANTKLRIEDKG